MYFVDMNNFYNAIIIFDTGLCVVLFVQFVFKIRSHENKKQYIKGDWRGVIIDIIAMMPYELLTFGSYGILRLLRLFKIFALFGKSRRNIFNFIEKTKLNYLHQSFDNCYSKFYCNTGVRRFLNRPNSNTPRCCMVCGEHSNNCEIWK